MPINKKRTNYRNYDFSRNNNDIYVVHTKRRVSGILLPRGKARRINEILWQITFQTAAHVIGRNNSGQARHRRNNAPRPRLSPLRIDWLMGNQFPPINTLTRLSSIAVWFPCPSVPQLATCLSIGASHFRYDRYSRELSQSQFTTWIQKCF